MWRRWSVLLAGLVGAVLLGGPAGAAPLLERSRTDGRADAVAAALRRDPVYVTDHAPRALPPDAAARIKASVARLGVPVYVAVTPVSGLGPQNPSESFAALLRDRLGKDGVYIVVPPSGGGGEIRQFGAVRGLPLDDAWSAAGSETAYDVGAPELIARFVDIALSGRARERRDHPRPRPESKVRKALDADDAADRRAARIEWGVFAGGTALSGGSILGLLVGRRVRSARRAAAPKRPPRRSTGKSTRKARG
ncbi:hypothetical protein [Actinomadura coerulea]|uniref:hypothetical protein n=1 Tax=Actinomadura coerulea TaxID=46159 RepID=UPI0034263248